MIFKINCFIKRFSAVIMRMREPRATGLIFASGKMVITGSKSAEESLLSARKIARVISKLGFQVTFSDFRIQNVVATSDLKMKLNLCAIATSDHAKYVNVFILFILLIYHVIIILIFVFHSLSQRYFQD